MSSPKDPRQHLCRLTALTSLAISNSSFSGPIPANFSSFPALLSFTAVGNKLTGALPSSLPPKLTTLNVGYNQLNGSLPAYNSSTLSYLQVSYLQLPSVPNRRKAGSVSCWLPGTPVPP